MRLIIDIPEAVRTTIINRANNGVAMHIGIQAVMVKAIVDGTPLDDIKAEISSNLITDGQVIEGEYFAEDAEYINHGLNMALEIIDKHIGENTRHLKYAGEYADQDTMMPAT